MEHRRSVHVKRVDEVPSLHELFVHCLPAFGGAYLYHRRSTSRAQQKSPIAGALKCLLFKEIQCAIQDLNLEPAD